MRHVQQFGTLIGRYVARLGSQRVLLISFLVALLLLGLGGALVARAVAEQGGTSVEQAATMRAMGWKRGSSWFAQFLSVLIIVLGATQISGDARSGALFSILARPVSRAKIFASGWCAAALLLLTLELLRAIVWIVAAGLVGPNVTDLPLVLGVLALVCRDWLLLALFAALGAILPVAYSVLAGLCVLYLGAFAFSGALEGLPGIVIDSAGALLPLIGRQSVVLRALVGQPAEVPLLVEAIAYELAWTVLLLCMGAWAFRQRDLSPRT